MLTLLNENDMWGGTDRYYTNAVQMRLISPDLNSPDENEMLPDGMSRLLNDVPDDRLKPPKNMDVEGGKTKGEPLWKD